MLKKVMVCLLSFALCSGCASNSEKSINKKNEQYKINNQNNFIKNKNNVADINNNLISKKIYNEFAKWKGTPYKFGGTSKKGIDCSSFVQNVYGNGLNYSIPRSTYEQLKIGQKVSINNLKPGDLIFFQTSKNQRHVGVYINSDKFAHASSSKGVMISSINNSYWKSKYRESRRILNNKDFAKLNEKNKDFS